MAYIDEQTKRINDMYANLKKQRTDVAASQNNQAITNLRRQLAEQLPQYQTARAQADVGQVQNMNKLKEYMASSGAFNSGDNFSRASNILTQRTNAINQINGNENTFTTGINNNIADTNTNYTNTVNSINSELDTQRMQELAALQARIREEELQKAREAQQQANWKAQFNYDKANADRQYALQLQQLALQKANRSSGGSGGSSSSSSKAQKTKDTNAVWNQIYNKIESRTAESFLKENREAIINNLGSTEYQKMLKYVKDYKYSPTENLVYNRKLKNATPQDYYAAY